jgi:predicted aldo/keto reductase-like oxidoreductase
MAERGITRREFMVTGAMGVATLGLGGLPGPASAGKVSAGAPEIVYRTLGRTGLKIPVVSFGVMNSDSPDLIRKALDLGIKHFDTAHRYLRGNSETVIGQVLEERKCRDRVYLGTKMYFDRDKERKVFYGEESPRPYAATEKKFEEQLGLSLRRLRTDYVDILYLHSCEGPLMAAYEPMMKTFVKAREAGKARFIGITTHTREPETIRAAADAGVWDVVLTSYNFMQDHKDEVAKAIEYAAGKGMGIVAMKTQGGVKMNREDPGQVNHAAALKWVLNDRNVCTTIPGMTAFDQMDLDFGVMKNLALSERERRDLRLLAARSGPLYCQQCGSCLNSCSRGVDIPTLMRAYMYAEGYHNLIQAELAMAEVPEGQGLERCGACGECTARCRFGINIRDRVDSLMAMHLCEGRLA